MESKSIIKYNTDMLNLILFRSQLIGLDREQFISFYSNELEVFYYLTNFLLEDDKALLLLDPKYINKLLDTINKNRFPLKKSINQKTNEIIKQLNRCIYLQISGNKNHIITDYWLDQAYEHKVTMDTNIDFCDILYNDGLILHYILEDELDSLNNKEYLPSLVYLSRVINSILSNNLKKCEQQDLMILKGRIDYSLKKIKK